MPINNRENRFNNNNFNFQNQNINMQNMNRTRANSFAKFIECPKCHQLIEERLKEDHKLSHRIDEREKRKYERRNLSRDDRNFRPMNNNRHNRHINNINSQMNDLFVEFEYLENEQNNDRNVYEELLNLVINSLNNDNNNNHHRHHANEEQLAFPEIVIDDVNKLDEANKSCTICLDEFKSNEKVIALPCLHYFHKKCIKKWMERKKECPVCKFELTQENIDKKMKYIYH